LTPDATEWGVKPDPGLEVIVEGAEFEAWSREHGQRDLDVMAGAPASATDKPSTFKDRVLERALEALKGLTIGMQPDARHNEPVSEPRISQMVIATDHLHVSMVLTPLVIPFLYIHFDDLAHRFRRNAHCGVGQN
jgi:hypothetical protein